MADRDKFVPPPMMGNRGGPATPGGPMRGMIVEKPRNFRATMARLWSYFQEERATLLVTFAMVALGALVTLVTPYLFGRAVDALNVDLGLVGTFALFLTVAYLCGGVSQFLQGFIMAGISQRTVKRLRSALFDHFQALPVSFFDTHTHGDLMSRLTNDIDNISTTISSSVSQLMGLVLSLVGSLVMMLLLSPSMTAAMVIPAGLALLLTRTVTKRTRPLYSEQQKELGALSAQLEENISGLTVVHGFNHEAQAIAEFSDLNERYFKASLFALIWSGFLMPLMNVINNLGLALVSGLGSYFALQGTISVGVIASFINYSRQFTRPLNDIANIYNTLQTAVAGAERVFDIFDQAHESPDSPGAVALRDVRGEVEFRNVSFGYRPDVAVLSDVSFRVPAGSSLALVGPTGAGKTTIVNLLARFYELSAGSITIDGKDIRGYTRDSLRRAFGIVLQDTYLFTGTIRENIRYGNPEATDAQVEAAARQASAHSFIKRLPQGYDTQLTESGNNLSAGQRQLLAIARAILADSPILILDEATSNVDTRTELRIQNAMLELMHERTTFVIAHRLSTIRDATRILVIDGGRIVEQGNHAALLAAGGIYAQMWNSQLENAG